MSEQPERESGVRRAPGALESAVWALVRAAEAPVSASEVRERLGGDLAHTTVVTTLGRLHSKGVLTRSLDGRAHRYAPATSQEGLAARRMQRALEAEADHEAVLSRFVSDLSGQDEALLRRLLGDDIDPHPEPDSGSGPGPGTAGREG